MPTEDKMDCEAQICQDSRDSIGPDGKCHAYDETLEKRHETLKGEAKLCADSVKQMGEKIKELMSQLQKETEKSDQLANELSSEKELSQQFKDQRDNFSQELDQNKQKLTQVQRKFDLEQQSKMQIFKQLQEEQGLIEQCQGSKDKL